MVVFETEISVRDTYFNTLYFSIYSTLFYFDIGYSYFTLYTRSFQLYFSAVFYPPGGEPQDGPNHYRPEQVSE